MEARTGDPIFSVRNLRHRHAAREVLKDVSLTVHQGDRLGLLGVNGAGKTTLLRIMAGALKADAGELNRKRGLTVGYLPQEFALAPGATVLEAVQEGARETRVLLDRYQALSERLADAADPAVLAEQTELQEVLEHRGAWHLDREIETVMGHLRVPPADRLAGGLSGGEARRVSLARALVGKPDLLILDEPTNHLDTASIAWLESYLADYRGACLLVTHDRYFLDRVANRIVELEAGQLQSYTGNYTDYLLAKAERLAAAEKHEQVRQNTLRRELAWVRKQPRARQAKSKAREEAFYSLAADAPPQTPDELRLKIPTGPTRLGRKILELDKVGKSQGDKRLFEDLSLALTAGDRIGVVGANGLGKTTLMRVLQGLVPPDAGTVSIGPNTRFVYADQGRGRLDGSKTLIEEVAAGGRYLTVGDESITVRSYLRRFLFPDDQHDAPIEKFSGGEQNRAQLAKLLAEGGNVLILDEPTNDLDLQTLRALEDALVDFPGCAFIVSHDRYFLNRVATAILAFEGDGRVRYAIGDYDRYMETRQAEARPEPAQRSVEPAPRAPEKAAARKLSFKEKQELAGMEAAIGEAEGRLAELEARLADPALYTAGAGADVPGIMAEAEALRARIETLYSRWEALEALPG